MRRDRRCDCALQPGTTAARRAGGGRASKGSKSTRKGKSRSRKAKNRRPRQLTIFDGRHGGPRAGSGPKPKAGAGVPHDRREQFKKKPVHVTLRVIPDRMGLRNHAESEEVLAALEAGGQRSGFHLVQYSIQWDHLHLIIEANDEVTLAAGMKSLCVRIARGLNRLWKRTGRVFADRYHAHVIRCPREMRNVLRYVLCNGRKHGAHTAPGPDPLSSGPAYQGWSDVSPELAIPDPASWSPHPGSSRTACRPNTPSSRPTKSPRMPPARAPSPPTARPSAAAAAAPPESRPPPHLNPAYNAPPRRSLLQPAAFPPSPRHRWQRLVAPPRHPHRRSPLNRSPRRVDPPPPRCQTRGNAHYSPGTNAVWPACSE